MICGKDPTDILKPTQAHVDKHQTLLSNKNVKDLDHYFKKMVEMRTNFLSKQDPVNESYLEMVDGLLMIHEKNNLRVFINEFLDIQVIRKRNEELKTQLEAKRDLLSNNEREFLKTIPTWFELVEELKINMKIKDEKEHRAADFVLNSLQDCTAEEVEYRKNYLELLVFEAEDRK